MTTIKDERDEREAKAEQIAAQMPEDRGGILCEAMAAIDAIDAAVLACDDGAAEAAALRYEAAIWKLNGKTYFGCMAGPDAGGVIARKVCSAPDGTAPKWGQAGEFVATVQGTRALVSVSEGFGVRSTHFEFRAVDLDRPFISQTGYRSCFATPTGGATVKQAAEAMLAEHMSNGMCMVGDDYRVRRVEDERPWLAELATQPVEAFADATGQLGFSF
ncbi:hypothetical protein BVER_00857c [Candidatus Burkholderia verschuerenii]|uniref:Uncharacterized protein n=1 Tax=Candidatus Burkholderia verschuerenii TaxID=242163 RepID=A0A0L0MF97_9BURK|nr:hypothetical protein [Candidatus Burkholderia verschuerenii]KND60976.1 hypothetical protein BVER_00857c [Candidatus Burkholderia verschuerenii]